MVAGHFVVQNVSARFGSHCEKDGRERYTFQRQREIFYCKTLKYAQTTCQQQSDVYNGLRTLDNPQLNVALDSNTIVRNIVEIVVKMVENYSLMT